MGTVLGLVFILAAATAGVLVGTRPTVMDGGWIAGKLKGALQEEGVAVECDREIPVGVKGAEFVCVHSRPGAHQQVWYRMARDGELERTRAGRITRGTRAGRAAGEAGDAVEAGEAGEAADGPGAGEADEAGEAGEAGED